MSKKYKDIIIDCLLTILIIVGIFFIVKIDIKRYDETCCNTPGEFWIEEDLEMVFLTTQVNVIEIDDLGDGLLIVKVLVYDEESYCTYRCLYKVKRKWIGVFVWEFERYVTTSYIEVKNQRW
jgi:hypothetical protein